MSHTYLAMFVPYTQQVILLHSNREIRDLNPLVCFSLDKKLAFGVSHSFFHLLSFGFCCSAVLERMDFDYFETKLEDVLDVRAVNECSVCRMRLEVVHVKHRTMFSNMLEWFPYPQHWVPCLPSLIMFAKITAKSSN